MLHFMLADYLLRVLGRTPEAYPDQIDKWAVIAADLVDFAVPIVLVLFFFLPLLVVRLWLKRFTSVNVVVALVIGGLLALGGYWLNQWSYGYGVGVIWHAINEQ